MVMSRNAGNSSPEISTTEPIRPSQLIAVCGAQVQIGGTCHGRERDGLLLPGRSIGMTSNGFDQGQIIGVSTLSVEGERP